QGERSPADRARAARRPGPGPGAPDRQDGPPPPEAPGCGPVRRTDAGVVGRGQTPAVVRAQPVAPAPSVEAGAARTRGGDRRLVAAIGDLCRELAHNHGLKIEFR